MSATIESLNTQLALAALRPLADKIARDIFSHGNDQTPCHPESVVPVVQLRHAGFQQCFTGQTGHPIYNIVAVAGSDPAVGETALQSPVTIKYIEQLGFKVEVLP